MSGSLKIALAQLNPIVGDIEGNIAKLCAARGKAAAQGADLVVCTELVVTGYPPEDLVLRPTFQNAVEAAVERLAGETDDGGPGLLIGTPWRDDGKLYNAVMLLDGGSIAAKRFKHDLPNYGVFDEQRIFAAGPLPGPIPFRGALLGAMVCEDMWFPDVAETLSECGANLLVVLNGSPYHSEKIDVRLNLAVARVTETSLPLIYVNQVGGQDELVFDGASFILDQNRTLKLQAPAWQETVLVSDWTEGTEEPWDCADGPITPEFAPLEAIYWAMVLGLRDYVNKNGFPGVIIGLSGGIDSALTAVVAVDALGADKVICVTMPSRYSSDHSVADARELASRANVRCENVPIEPAHRAFDGMLSDLFAGREPNETEENIQARIRGVILMALSNKFGHMVVTTGNKSEMSVGYATLYGDMCGGFSVIKDVYKTTVYALCEWRNSHRPDGLLGPDGEVVPVHIITKPPSAELRPNQIDQDSLPPYDALDDILEGLVEDELSVEEIVARGHDIDTVKRIRRLLLIAEYKRRQAPPGVKITRRAYGRDRRYPITNGFITAE